jgi:hypothetical protein
MALGPPFAVAVVSAGSGRPQSLDVRREMALVKAALLYADEVELACGGLHLLTHQMYHGLAGVLPDSTTDTAISDLLSNWERGHRWSAAMRALAEVRGRKSITPNPDADPVDEELAALVAFTDNLWADLWDRLLSLMDLTAAPGTSPYALGEMRLALDAGVLDLAVVPSPGFSYDDRGRQGVLADDITAYLEAALFERPMYPFFDRSAHELVSPSGAAGAPADASLRYAALATTMVSSLEAFPNATMDVVLDVRKQLKGPLKRFRAAVISMTEEVTASPLTPESFRRESYALWHKEVAPALQELDELASDLKVRATLRRGLPGGVAGAISVAAAAAVGAPDLAPLALAPLAPGALEELKLRADQRKARKKNNFFFLWDANRRFAASGDVR